MAMRGDTRRCSSRDGLPREVQRVVAPIGTGRSGFDKLNRRWSRSAVTSWVHPGSRVMDRHHLEHLVAAVPVALLHDPDAAGVELLRQDAGLQAAPLEGAHPVVEATQGSAGAGAVPDDPGLVLRVSAVVLLPERLPGVGVRRHDHPGHGAVVTGLPGPLTGLDV